MTYLNEQLVWGNLGYFFIILSFSASLLAFFSYTFASTRGAKEWLVVGRASFVAHGVAVIGIFAVLFYLIFTQQYQYHYVWAHSSQTLPLKYIISCFWEGQEGSFLLWTFWQFVLGLFIMRKRGVWEAPVLAVVALAGVMLSSMLLGIEQIDLGFATLSTGKIGSNPFILLRNVFPDIPLFRNPNYTASLLDGNGLNPLLQNYWMVIHPPVLFLGFASTIIPFAYAIGGITTGKAKEWVKPALPWATFLVATLGLGILMGGAWAYEALSFGGFWAWDPVENSSLVPWIIGVAALHVMLIYRVRKKSLAAAAWLCVITYLLVLYSTFLTRSGILGDSSVHSFTDLGLSGQLLLFLLLFVFLAIFILIRFRKHLSSSARQEDNVYSREFWIFIGALTLCMSALHITVLTSLEVVNKLNSWLNSFLHFGLPSNLTKPADAVEVYQQLQVPFAILIAIFIGFTQYLKWKKTLNRRSFWTMQAMLAGVACLLTLLLAYWSGLTYYKYVVLLWAALYAFVVNAYLLVSTTPGGGYTLRGSAIAHTGFALLLTGALVANARQEPISLNTERFEALQGAPELEQRTNKVLFQNQPVTMGGYRVTYLGDSAAGDYIYFTVDYEKLDNPSNSFTLTPYVLYNTEEDKMSAPSPDTRRTVTHDLFTHVTSASKRGSGSALMNFDTSYTANLAIGDSYQGAGFSFTLSDIKKATNDSIGGMRAYKLVADGSLLVNGTSYAASPSFIIQGNTLVPEPFDIEAAGIRILYNSLDPVHETHQLVFMVGEPEEPSFITLKAIIFPGINLLWLGSITMVIGSLLAVYQRLLPLKPAR